LWSKLDDSFIDHPKIYDAGARIGKNGTAIAVGLFCVGLCWSNKHLSDGYLSTAVFRSFHHCADPLLVARALVAAGLWDAVPGGFKIHDFLDWNYSAVDVNARRQAERDRRRNGGRNSHART